MVEAIGVIADFARFGSLVGIFAMLALALNLQWGKTGLFNAGIAGFWGLGAYVASMVVTNPVPSALARPGHWGINQTAFPSLAGVSTSFSVAIVLAAIVAGVLALLIAIPTMRLRADYFAIATLGLSEIVMNVFVKNLPGITGGVEGITQVPRPFEFGREAWKTELSYFLLVLGVVIVLFFLLERLVRSPWGRVLTAVREDEDAAQALGKDTFSLKLQAFVLGAGIMGMSGAFFAFWLRGVSPPPNLFTAADTFGVWVIVIIGGSGNNRGVLAGAFVVPFLEFFSVRAKDWFSLVDPLATQIFYFRLIAIGVVLILLIMWRPQGIFPEPKFVAKRPRWVIGR